MISHEYKFIFVHIPKCGGTSIERVFVNKDITQGKHQTLSQFPSKYSTAYYKFSFVRNPWDMTTSLYRFLWESLYSWPVQWRKAHPKFSQLSFREWVTHPFFKSSPSIRSLDVVSPRGQDGSFRDWLSSDSCKIDFIGRFENLQEDFDKICCDIDIAPVKLPHINKTDGPHYTTYYDDETREIVRQKYQEDIKFFNYKFG